MKRTLLLLVLLSGLTNYSHAGIIATFDFIPPEFQPSTTGMATLNANGMFTFSRSGPFTEIGVPGFPIDGFLQITEVYVGTLSNNQLIVDSALSTYTFDSCISATRLCSLPGVLSADGNLVSINDVIGIERSQLDVLNTTISPITFNLSIDGITNIDLTFGESNLGVTYTFITTSISQVPEPSVLVLMSTGLIGLAALRRKTR